MYILGISGLADVEPFLRRQYSEYMAETPRIVQGMDAAAALVHNGAVIAAASEERFDRQKKSSAFPIRAINYCMNEAGISFRDIDAVCGNFNFGRYAAAYHSDEARTYWKQCLSPDAIRQKLSDQFNAPVRFEPIDHHDAHLHSALLSAPFDDCIAIVMDAAGEIGSTSVYHVAGGEIRRLRRYGLNQSLGVFYSLITQFLGFAFNEDEYKVMGLAALGDPDCYCSFFESAIILREDGEISIPCLALNRSFADRLFFRGSSAAIEAALGFDGRTCSMAQRADVSAALQKRFTEALLHLCRHFTERSGHRRNLLLSGGCAENCSAVGELRVAGPLDRVHVSYASGDEGTALGAAAALAGRVNQTVRAPGQMPFFGPAPDIAVVRDLRSKYNIAVEEFAHGHAMLEAAADAVAADRIVGLCNGRMEFGARALGNRSLLALPSKAANKDRVNLVIKKRQNYRPFAPAVLAEDAHRYFDLRPNEAYPYMTMLTRVHTEAATRLPAITHVDGTARVQTVDQQHNPAFYHLLSHLKRITDMGVVLNTSYNVNHQPIVCSEAEAIETFLEMGIDALYMANTKITRAA